jgi:hypothetical protein
VVQHRFRHHAEKSSLLRASAEQVFAYLDDHSRLSAHMSRRSWRMGWGRFELRLDELKGRAVGSHIRLAGTAFGLRLELDEVVVEYEPPTRKIWETVGQPRLLVIGPYQMGYSIGSASGEADPRDHRGVRLAVFIDYSLPSGPFGRFLGYLFGHWYARWCVARMVAEADAAFGHRQQPSRPDHAGRAS